MINEKILIVEDDPEIASLISDYLKSGGYETDIALNGELALEYFHKNTYDLLIVDLMIPKIDGFEICRKIREMSSIPIIIVSAKKEDQDKILGLGLGADDYVTKPFSPRELLARVQTHLRRFKELSKPEGANTFKLIIGDLEINPSEYTVKVRGKEVPFSVKEFEILYYLAQNPNQALSRERIFDKIWGFNEYGDINTVTVHMRKIREKIEVDPSSPKFIETVWGIGYKFRVSVN